MAAQNNTTGASIYDLGEIIQADSLGTLTSALKRIENTAQAKKEQEMAQAQQMAQQQSQSAEKMKAMEIDSKERSEEKDRRKDRS